MAEPGGLSSFEREAAALLRGLAPSDAAAGQGAVHEAAGTASRLLASLHGTPPPTPGEAAISLSHLAATAALMDFVFATRVLAAAPQPYRDLLRAAAADPPPSGPLSRETLHHCASMCESGAGSDAAAAEDAARALLGVLRLRLLAPLLPRYCAPLILAAEWFDAAGAPALAAELPDALSLPAYIAGATRALRHVSASDHTSPSLQSRLQRRLTLALRLPGGLAATLQHFLAQELPEEARGGAVARVLALITSPGPGAAEGEMADHLAAVGDQCLALLRGHRPATPTPAGPDRGVELLALLWRRVAVKHPSAARTALLQPCVGPLAPFLLRGAPFRPPLRRRCRIRADDHLRPLTVAVRACPPTPHPPLGSALAFDVAPALLRLRAAAARMASGLGADVDRALAAVLAQRPPAHALLLALARSVLPHRLDAGERGDAALVATLVPDGEGGVAVWAGPRGEAAAEGYPAGEDPAQTADTLCAALLSAGETGRHAAAPAVLVAALEAHAAAVSASAHTESTPVSPPPKPARASAATAVARLAARHSEVRVALAALLAALLEAGADEELDVAQAAAAAAAALRAALGRGVPDRDAALALPLSMASALCADADRATAALQGRRALRDLGPLLEQAAALDDTSAATQERVRATRVALVSLDAAAAEGDDDAAAEGEGASANASPLRRTAAARRRLAAEFRRCPDPSRRALLLSELEGEVLAVAGAARGPAAEAERQAVLDLLLSALMDPDPYVHQAATRAVVAAGDRHCRGDTVSALVAVFGDARAPLPQRLRTGQALAALVMRLGDVVGPHAAPILDACLEGARGAARSGPSSPAQHAPSEPVLPAARARPSLFRQAVREHRQQHGGGALPSPSLPSFASISAGLARGAAGGGGAGPSPATRARARGPVHTPGAASSRAADHLFRASCISLLGQVAAQLKLGVQPYLQRILSQVTGVLRLEAQAQAQRPGPGEEGEEVADARALVRRGAATVLAGLANTLKEPSLRFESLDGEVRGVYQGLLVRRYPPPALARPRSSLPPTSLAGGLRRRPRRRVPRPCRARPLRHGRRHARLGDGATRSVQKIEPSSWLKRAGRSQ